jgi:hypothetical protein
MGLMIGDIILSCDGKIVTRMYDLNVHYFAESVKLVRQEIVFADLVAGIAKRS